MLDSTTISHNLNLFISEKQSTSRSSSKSSPKEQSSPGENKAMDPLFEYLNMQEVDNILSSFLSEWTEADRHIGELTIKWMTGLANYAFAVVNFYRCSESSSQISKVTKCVGFMQSTDIESIEFAFASKCKINRLFLDFKPREYIDLLIGHGFYTTMHDEQIRFPDIRDRASAAAAAASPAAADLFPTAPLPLSTIHRTTRSSAAAHNYDRLHDGGGNKTRKMFIHKNKNQSMLRKHQTTNRFRLHRNKHNSQRRNK
jgi:hypothetical protein